VREITVSGESNKEESKYKVDERHFFLKELLRRNETDRE